jgi:hypothetical protein
LEAYTFSATQAVDFLTHWKVIDQIPNTSTGFSATVFERLEDGKPTGERIIAVRGTEGSKIVPGAFDLATDLADVGADGIAINQAIDMYNWYLRMISPAGPEKQYKYIKEEIDNYGNITIPASIVETAEPFTNTEAGVPYSGSEPATVVGHSLGGHLAEADDYLTLEVA